MRDDVGVLVVFTAKSVAQILEHGGTQSWVLNAKSMQHVEYVVCTRNSDHQHDEECGIRTEAHNSAFLVGKVSGMKKVDRRHERDRYLIEFSEYANVDRPNFRSGSSRNPVTYSDVGQCRANGIDFAALEFIPMPTPETDDESKSALAGKKGLSIADAKEGLAMFFGVPTESIQITISA
jgi:hypothetical protein